MKILHTSDWHLGHMLYGYDRKEEQQSMLDQMVEIVRDNKPDAFILAGDVYDTPQPSAAVQTLLTKMIVKLHDVHPTMPIIMTAGNHDSGSKHEIFRTPWEALNVYAIGQLNKKDPETHIIEIPGKGYILAIPYTHERNIPDGFFQLLLDKTVERNTDQLPVFMTAHATIQGCDYAGHERATEYIVGGIDTIGVEQIGKGYDYLALGHIHKPQFIHTGHHNVRYSGTPIAVSFDENYDHSVTMVEISHHDEKPVITTLPITNLHPLVTLPTDGYASWEEAKELLRNYPNDIPAYIRLNVQIDDFLPVDAKSEAIRIAESKQCQFCHINAKRKCVNSSETSIMTIQEFQSEQPIEIVKRYADYTGIVFDEEMQEMFKQVEQLVQETNRN